MSNEHLDEIGNTLATMKHSAVRNYALPGLTSALIGGNNRGLVRLFESDRNTEELITPHSHRFDFTCLVLRGSVDNTIYQRGGSDPYSDRYVAGTITRGAKPGEYETFEPGTEFEWWSRASHIYGPGDVYSMCASEVHSIKFSRGARVLFLEGPEITHESTVLEPWSDGRRVPTFTTQPWMFEKVTP